MHRTHCFIDESGDAGTSRGKKHFTMCAFITASRNACHELLKKQREGYPDYFKGQEMNREIKAQNLDDPGCAYFLRGINGLDCIARVGYLDTYKPSELNSLQPIEKKVSMAKTLILTCSGLHKNLNSVILDKGILTPKQLSGLKSEMQEQGLRIPSIKSKTSLHSAGLAYADLVASATRKNLGGDTFLYSAIKNKVKLSEF